MDLTEHWCGALSSDTSLPSKSKEELLPLKLTGFRIPSWKVGAHSGLTFAIVYF